MAVTLSPGLQSVVDAAPRTKKGFSDALRSGLGDSRRLILAKGGTPFLNVGMTGPMALSVGNITGFGTASGVTVRQAADLLNGGGILRIEGNGNWYQATIGLSRAAQIAARVAGGMTQAEAEAAVVAYDYYLPANPTATTGYAFATTAKIKAPRFYSSGTGPAAPTIAPTTPTIIELEDWTDPANPVLVGQATFGVRQIDWIFSDSEMAAGMGDIAIYELNETIKWNHAHPAKRFELGGLLILAANVNTEAGVPLEQILCAFKPWGRWPSYPAMDTFKKANRPILQGGWPPTYGEVINDAEADRTNLPPFKVYLKTANGQVVHVHEWSAFNDKPSHPINSPLLSEVQTASEPSMPRFNCGQWLPWQNSRTSKAAKAQKYIPGVQNFAYEGIYSAKSGASSNPYMPLAVYEASAGTAGSQQNSAGHWFALPPYPLKADFATDSPYLTAYESRPRDPELWTNRDHYSAYRAMGYKFQAGSISGHDWITGKGGQRFDRSAIPSVLAIYAANQNWVRPEGNVPIKDLMDGWGFAYFNHGNHWLRDAKTFQGIPKSEVIAGHWVFANAYYGGGPYGAVGAPGGPDKTIDICGIGNGKGRWKEHNDADGYMYYGGWQRDSLHSYANAGLWAIMASSPMHAIAQTHDFNTQWMCSLGSAPATANPTGYYMTRVHAWRWLAYVVQWKVSTDHPLGYTTEQVEARMQAELERIYDAIYKPAYLDNVQTPYFAAIRNLGVPASPTGDNLQAQGGSLAWYLVHVMFMMRQFGMWSTMKKRSEKCKRVLEMVIAHLDKQCIDYILDTDGRDIYYQVLAGGKTAGAYTAADIPASWAAQKDMLDTHFPVVTTKAQADAVGSSQKWKSVFETWEGRAAEHDGCTHLCKQYLEGRGVYFPEYPAPRLPAAITKMQGHYDLYAAKRAAGLAFKMAYQFPSHGVLLQPSEIGPN